MRRDKPIVRGMLLLLVVAVSAAVPAAAQAPDSPLPGAIVEAQAAPLPGWQAPGESTFCGGAIVEIQAAPLPGPPPIVVEPPPVGLRSLDTTIQVRATGDLPAAECPLVVQDAAGDIVGRGVLATAGEVEIVLRSATGGTFTVFLPDHYAQGVTFDLRLISGWLTLLPPFLAILVALLFRQVLVALLAGVWVGAFIVHQGPLTGALRTLDRYIVGTLADADRVAILVFTLLLGGMVGVLSRSGGTVGLVEALSPYATSSRRGQLVAWFMGLLIFFDDYANSLLVGNTMRPVTDRLKISREKLAYIVDSTAAPVASIALISTWIGYQVSLIGDALVDVGSQLDPYTVFLQSLPYNFYPLLSLVLGFTIAISVRDFGPMLLAERRAAAGKVMNDGAMPLADFDSSDLAPPVDKPRRWINAVVPILAVLGVTFAGLWITGNASMLESGYVRGSASLVKFVGDLFGAADSYRSLLWASAAGSLVALVLAIGQRILTMNEGMSAWVNGMKSMMMAVLILVLAWSISDVCDALNTRGFLVEALSDTLDPRLLPALVFVLAAATAFATGSSWATMGILIPLTVPSAVALALGADLDAGQSHSILLAAVSSVLAGAIFGDHCSPISDTTVLSSTASGCDHVDHVRTQLPYALAAAVIALLFGYIPAGYGVSPLISLPLATAALIGIVYWRGRAH